jgi:hypothetical protein
MGTDFPKVCGAAVGAHEAFQASWTVTGAWRGGAHNAQAVCMVQEVVMQHRSMCRAYRMPEAGFGAKRHAACLSVFTRLT